MHPNAKYVIPEQWEHVYFKWIRVEEVHFFLISITILNIQFINTKNVSIIRNIIIFSLLILTLLNLYYCTIPYTIQKCSQNMGVINILIPVIIIFA
jgi:hypothetical protein